MVVVMDRSIDRLYCSYFWLRAKCEAANVLQWCLRHGIL